MISDTRRAHRLHAATRPSYWVRRPSAHLTVSDPWEVVERHSTGLLRYTRARGTMGLPVIYLAEERRLYFRIPEFNDACHFLDRADLALDVDACQGGRCHTVRVTGLGLMIADSEAPNDIVSLLHGWPGGVATRLVVLIAEHIRHTSMSDDARHPPLPPTDRRLPGTFADT